MNATQLLYCDQCNKPIKTKSKSKHGNSKSHIHEKEYGTAVKENEVIWPKFNGVIYTINDNFKHCRNKYFRSFENRCVNDIEFKNMEKGEDVFIRIIIGDKKFKSQFYELNKNSKVRLKMDLYLVK